MKSFQTLLYYKYVAIAEPEEFAKKHLKFCNELGLKGRILVAAEGINGSVSGTVEQCKAYMDAMHQDEKFSDLWFKIEEVNEPSFTKMHVRHRHELVTIGDKANYLDPHKITGNYLEPEEWLKVKDQDNVIILDTRNKVEHELGKFKNAVTLDIEHFREFPEKMKELEQFKDKKILAYCTGGIRCEKATAFLLENGFKDVNQLHGGIINYYQKTGGKDFEGRCYVFDNRISTNVNDVNPAVISACLTCGAKTTRMVNCANPDCNNHYCQCEACGEKMEGSCSQTCMESPRKRPYNGTGYYVKGKEQVINQG